MTNGVLPRTIHGDAGWLHAYVDGQLSDGERALVEAHLAACPVCRDEVAILTALGAVLVGLPDLPLARDLAPAVLAALPTPAEPQQRSFEATAEDARLAGAPERQRPAFEATAEDSGLAGAPRPRLAWALLGQALVALCLVALAVAVLAADRGANASAGWSPASEVHQVVAILERLAAIDAAVGDRVEALFEQMVESHRPDLSWATLEGTLATMRPTLWVALALLAGGLLGLADGLRLGFELRRRPTSRPGHNGVLIP